MKIPFVGPSSTARSTNQNCERTVNCYLEMDKESPSRPVALYGTPGLVLRATLGAGATRGCLASGAYWYFVAGNHVYRIDAAYAVVDCGAIGTSTGRVGMATNGTQLLIVDGLAGWLVTGTSLAQITDVDFPNGVTQASFQDGYFIVGADGSQKFYWNETPNDGTSWNGLDFASAEGSPDPLLAVLADHRQLWLLGTISMEVFQNTGDASQLFGRYTFGEMGTAAPWTIAAMDNTVFWLTASKNGQGIVVRAEGYTPNRISSHALETAMREYSTISDAFAFCWEIDGHSFYVLSFPTADATWFFDSESGEWFEWLWRDASDNTLHRHRANCHAFANGVHMVGDWETGEVYSLEMDVYTDNGDAIKRLRRTQTMRQGAGSLFFGELLVDMEAGVANADCTDPQVMLRYSNDDGNTWSNEKLRSIGKVGEYAKRVHFPPSGCTKKGRGRVWELSMTDPVKFALFGADVDAMQGS